MNVLLADTMINSTTIDSYIDMAHNTHEAIWCEMRRAEKTTAQHTATDTMNKMNEWEIYDNI